MRARRGAIGAVAAMLLTVGAHAAFAQDDYSRPGPYLSLGFTWGKQAFNVEDLEDSITSARRADQAARAPECAIAGRLPCNYSSLVDRRDTPGMDFRAGYRINEMFAAELNFQYLDNYELELRGTTLYTFSGSNLVENTIGDQRIASIASYNFLAAGRFYPMTGVFQPYLSAGIGGIYADVDTEDAEVLVPGSPLDPATVPTIDGGSDSGVVFAGKIGGGVDYYLTRNVALTFDVAWLLATDLDIDGLPEKVQLHQVPITVGVMYRF